MKRKYVYLYLYVFCFLIIVCCITISIHSISGHTARDIAIIVYPSLLKSIISSTDGKPRSNLFARLSKGNANFRLLRTYVVLVQASVSSLHHHRLAGNMYEKETKKNQ